MKVAIATTSSEKIEGIKRGFSRFFQEEIDIFFQKTESGVSEQPFDSETYIGARNRVDALKKALTENYDCYISCEAGIESYAGLYFNVQIVCILKNNQYHYGKSAGWQIPSNEIEVIKESNLDSYLRGKGIHCIEELLGPAFSRREAVAQATELALASAKLL